MVDHLCLSRDLFSSGGHVMMMDGLERNGTGPDTCFCAFSYPPVCSPLSKDAGGESEVIHIPIEHRPVKAQADLANLHCQCGERTFIQPVDGDGNRNAENENAGTEPQRQQLTISRFFVQQLHRIRFERDNLLTGWRSDGQEYE